MFAAAYDLLGAKALHPTTEVRPLLVDKVHRNHDDDLITDISFKHSTGISEEIVS